MYKRIATLVMLVIMIGLGPVQALAQDGTMNFSVTAVIPENQIDKSKSYFDLKMKPGQVQELEVLMNNPLDKEVIVENKANTAITNDNGIVDYSNPDPELDKTLKAPFSKITEIDKEITIPAKSSKTIKVKVTMPEEEFNGVILGGLHFTEKEDETKESDEKAGVQIKNRFAFAIGVLLRENDESLKPELALGKIAASQINYRNVLKANIQNTQPMIMPEMEIKSRVTKKGSTTALFEQNKQGVRMAPNSNFDFAVNWENKEFKPGKYTLNMTVSDGKDKWEWSKDFEISQKEAKELNDKAIELKVDNTKWYIIGGIAGVVLLLLVTFVLGQYVNKKKQKKKRRKNNSQKKRKKSTEKRPVNRKK
ncbi:hypothetical protein DOK67_0002534 [Enterococcus sp. DIV0212c]|uniref:DUF916 and DUF3324 domain-containing protein n=1 Tax=Enterococcus sp. DIV0212c TaxID=2230867 RepID=UPI001A9AA317|nr:DUF916 and DUF3324 domain-containing protein [Enterococcus sp. DIV0212c]MBO1353536.1 DUF916 and DUF3324 domain-containing protein [Enterococcus sp. DIV0212c]